MQALVTVSEIPLFGNAPHTIPATGDQTQRDQALPHTGLAAPPAGPRRAEPSAALPWEGTCAQAQRGSSQSPGYSLTSWNHLVNCSTAVMDAPRSCHLQSEQELPAIMAQLQLAELKNLGKETSLSQDVPPERLGL